MEEEKKVPESMQSVLRKMYDDIANEKANAKAMEEDVQTTTGKQYYQGMVRGLEMAQIALIGAGEELRLEQSIFPDLNE